LDKKVMSSTGVSVLAGANAGGLTQSAFISIVLVGACILCGFLGYATHGKIKCPTRRKRYEINSEVEVITMPRHCGPQSFALLQPQATSLPRMDGGPHVITAIVLIPIPTKEKPQIEGHKDSWSTDP
jgi:hypothetical protein